jgi:exodeoxyribonuclease VII large subunit
LSYFSRKFSQHIANAPATWIEAEVVSIKRYPSGVYLKLKDLNDEAFLPASSFVPEIIRKMGSVKEGSHIVFNAKPSFWVKRGELTMTLQDVQEVGVGDMLMRIEQLKQQLAQEGLFAPEKKRSLPFIPQRIGLICGKNAQAKDDILQNAARRWPSIEFEIREVSVGNSPNTPREVIRALQELDTIPEVDVIIIARGGGALEEVVFPFSDEQLVRAVFAVTTPVISAIGHETDMPLLDFVADFRASTPTDAAKNVVPNLVDEIEIIHQLHLNLNNSVLNRIERELQTLTNLSERPVLRAPSGILEPISRDLTNLNQRLQSQFTLLLERENTQFQALYAKVAALSPKRTLQRGYSIVYSANSQHRKVLKHVQDFEIGSQIQVQVANGEIGATVDKAS